VGSNYPLRILFADIRGCGYFCHPYSVELRKAHIVEYLKVVYYEIRFLYTMQNLHILYFHNSFRWWMHLWLSDHFPTCLTEVFLHFFAQNCWDSLVNRVFLFFSTWKWVFYTTVLLDRLAIIKICTIFYYHLTIKMARSLVLELYERKKMISIGRSSLQFN